MSHDTCILIYEWQDYRTRREQKKFLVWGFVCQVTGVERIWCQQSSSLFRVNASCKWSTREVYELTMILRWFWPTWCVTLYHEYARLSCPPTSLVDDFHHSLRLYSRCYSIEEIGISGLPFKIHFISMFFNRESITVAPLCSSANLDEEECTYDVCKIFGSLDPVPPLSTF